MPEGRALVHKGTTAPEYSATLGEAVVAVGGTYAEVPVSGSRGPAKAGKLIAMLAGEESVLDRNEPLLAPMGRDLRRIEQPKHSGPNALCAGTSTT
ncbi:MAG: NAD(P)-binding domain-containing protein [Pseudomonadota bacterium]